MTVRNHVPHSLASPPIFSNVFNALRRSRRRRPVSDRRYACPTSRSISAITTRTCGERPVSDTGGSVPCATSRFFARCTRWRSRSSARASARSALRRTLSCLARRRSRHSLLHVFCVFAAEAAGTYHRRHSQQRRRASVTNLRVIHQGSQHNQTAATFPTNYAKVDLVTAKRWISSWPAPKRWRQKGDPRFRQDRLGEHFRE